MDRVRSTQHFTGTRNTEARGVVIGWDNEMLIRLTDEVRIVLAILLCESRSDGTDGMQTVVVGCTTVH
jgi:hypothetical protein